MTETDKSYLFEHDRKVTMTNLNGEFDRKSLYFRSCSQILVIFIWSSLFGHVNNLMLRSQHLTVLLDVLRVA